MLVQFDVGLNPAYSKMVHDDNNALHIAVPTAQGTLKLSVIGHRCTIDQKAKINNCIVMDDVTIGEK